MLTDFKKVTTGPQKSVIYDKQFLKFTDETDHSKEFLKLHVYFVINHSLKVNFSIQVNSPTHSRSHNKDKGNTFMMIYTCSM